MNVSRINNVFVVAAMLALTAALLVAPATAGANPVRDTLSVSRTASGSTADWDDHRSIFRPMSAWRAGTFDTSFATTIADRRPAAPATNQFCGEEGSELGDLNNDGHADLAAGCDGGIWVYYWDPATRAFPTTPSVTLTASTPCTYGVQVVDLDADGRRDVVSGCPWRWVSGNGQGAFAFWLRRSDNTGFNAAVLVSDPAPQNDANCGYALDVGNLDGDQYPDVGLGCQLYDAGATADAGAITIFRGGAGGFTWESRVTPTGAVAGNACGRSLSFGNFDGIGFDDVAIGCPMTSWSSSGRAMVLMRNGTNTAFDPTPTVLAPGVLGPNCGLDVLATDFNGDGREDVMTGCPGADNGTNWAAGSVEFFYRNAGNTGFSASSDLFWAPTPVVNGNCGDFFAAGDVNGDALPDAAAGCTGVTNGVIVAQRRSDNSGFAAPSLLRPPTPQADERCGTAVGLGDIDADGRDEVAFGCYRFDTGGFNEVGRVIVSRVEPSREVAIPGVAAGDSCGESLNGGLAAGSGDVDGDGLDDLVQSCVEADPGSVADAGRVVVRESATGTWRSIVAPTPVAGDRCGDGIAVGDLNADGRDDLAIGCTGRSSGGIAAGTVEIYLRRATNDGFDHLTTLVQSSPVAGDACGVAVEVGDVDGDLRPDVAFGCHLDDETGSNHGSAWVVRRTGATTFGAATKLVSSSTSGSCGGVVGMGDADGDGRAEVSVACLNQSVSSQGNAGRVFVFRFRDDGSGWDQVAALAKTTPVVGDLCGHHDFGDVDGDGMQDVVVSCFDDDTLGTTDGGRAYLFRATGAGAFAAPVGLTHPVYGGGYCGMPTLLADVNVDGRDDVVFACRWATVGAVTYAGRVIVLVRNAANTDFELALDQPNPTPVSWDECGDSIAAGNFRPGGRPDLIVSCSGEDTGGTNAGGSLIELRNVSAGSFTSSSTLRTRSLASGSGITAATITLATQRHGQPAPQLLLSADGGTTWEAATSGVQHTFTTTGTDLRARVDFPTSTLATRMAYVHDLQASWVAGNVPNAPALVSPADTSGTSDTTPTLVATFSDADVANTGTLAFQVCSDAACSTVVRSGSSAAGIANGTNGSWTVAPALTAQGWWWRARATDSTGLVGPWSSIRSLSVPETLTLGVSSATVPLGSLVGGGDAFGSVTATITTNSADGWSLSATDASDTVGATGPGAATIPDWTGTNATPSAWSAGAGSFFGLTVRSAPGGRLAKWGTGTGTAETDVVANRYAGIRSGTATVLHQRTTYDPAAQAVVVTARAGASAGQAAGAYTTTVTLTAVGLP